jgi:hypothetical protein
MGVPIKYPYVGGTRWNFMKWADIPDARDESQVYLRRLRILQTPKFAIYLHFIFLPDEDRDPHDHPFNFWSFIIRGGYTERLWDIVPGAYKSTALRPAKKNWGVLSFHKMGQRQAHMISQLIPGTITLVFCGPKTGNGRWGFYTENGFVPWAKYNRQKYDEMA